MRTTMLATAAAALAAATVLLPAASPTAATATTAAATTSVGAAGPPSAAAPRGACGPGELCLWEKPDFRGVRQTHDLSGTDIDSCVPLPPDTSAQALVNRTGRPVTTYQSQECAETGEFETYPGGGTWVPQSPYRVRAFKVWER